MQNLTLLLVTAIGVVYIVLGMLYESYIHPITILSGLPWNAIMQIDFALDAERHHGEARRPLGLAVVGSLLMSQLITLYLTPVVYTYMAALGSTRRGTFA